MSRKLTLILLFFLFLLPFVSWYYLQSGLNWRKEAQQIMSGTKPFPQLPLISFKGVPMDKSQLEYHVSLVTIVSCDSLEDQMKLVTKLYSQFKSTKKANFIFIDTCQSLDLMLPDSMMTSSFMLHCGDSLNSCVSLLQDWPAGHSMALLDKKGVIRAYYPTHTHDEKKLLVEHMALLLPRDLGEKVEVKRKTE